MPGFKSANSYGDFARSVKSRARFMHTDEVQDFLKTVIETSESRRKNLKKGQTLARAQRGSEPRLEGEGEEEYYVDDAYSPERMKPKAELVGDGRVNPRGSHGGSAPVARLVARLLRVDGSIQGNAGLPNR